MHIPINRLRGKTEIFEVRDRVSVQPVDNLIEGLRHLARFDTTFAPRGSQRSYSLMYVGAGFFL